MQTVSRGQCNSSLNIFLEYKGDKSASVCHQLSRAGEKGNLHVERLKLALVFFFWVTAIYHVSFPRKSSSWKGFWWPNLKRYFFPLFKSGQVFFFLSSSSSVRFWPCWAWRAQRADVAQVLEIIMPCSKSLRTLPSLSLFLSLVPFFLFFFRLIWCLGAVSPIYFLLPALAAEF